MCINVGAGDPGQIADAGVAALQQCYRPLIGHLDLKESWYKSTAILPFGAF